MIKFLNYLALVTSITIAGIAAYFSVIGMATIFAGAYIGTIVMMTALEVGKLADMIILDKNPLKASPSEIKEIKVLETIKDGVIVYRRQ